jgi:hypothetical protein
MPDQILSTQLGDQVVQIIVELSVIADVAARAGSAMASDVGSDDQNVLGGELLGNAVHAGRVAARTVNQDRDLLLVAVGGRINPIGERAAVARLEI